MSQPCSRGTSATIMRRPSCRCSRRWNSIFWRERCTRAGGLRAAIAAARRPASHVCACRRRVAGGIMIVSPSVVKHVFLSCSVVNTSSCRVHTMMKKKIGGRPLFARVTGRRETEGGLSISQRKGGMAAPEGGHAHSDKS